MKKYLVTMPICGSVTVEVKANNEEEAKELAFESDQVNDHNRIEYDVLEYIVAGNVFYGDLNSVIVEEDE